MPKTITDLSNKTLLSGIKGLDNLFAFIDRRFGVNDHNDMEKSLKAKFVFLLLVITNFKLEDLRVDIPIYSQILNIADKVRMSNFLKEKFGNENVVNRILPEEKLAALKNKIANTQLWAPRISSAVSAILLLSALKSKKDVISTPIKLLFAWVVAAPLFADSKELVNEVNTQYSPTQTNFNGLIASLTKKKITPIKIDATDEEQYDFISEDEAPIEVSYEVDARAVVALLQGFVEKRDGAPEFNGLKKILADKMKQNVAARVPAMPSLPQVSLPQQVPVMPSLPQIPVNMLYRYGALAGSLAKDAAMNAAYQGRRKIEEQLDGTPLALALTSVIKKLGLFPN